MHINDAEEWVLYKICEWPRANNLDGHIGHSNEIPTINNAD